MPLFPGAFPPRPLLNSDVVYKTAAKVIAPRFMLHLGIEKTIEEIEAVEKILYETLEDAYDYDGYKLAKDLEDYHYYDLDSEAVNILGECEWEMRRAHSRLVTDWVKKYQIKPNHKKGDVLQHTTQVRTIRDKFPDGVDVTVTKVNLEDCSYHIFHPDLCVQEPHTGRMAFIVPFEKFDKLPVEDAHKV